MDRANEVWIDELRQPGPRLEAALGDLRADLLRGLRGALTGARAWTTHSLRTRFKKRS